MIKTDMQLKKDIEQELSWDPKINAAQIGVSVDKGVVSLLGTVDTYAEKSAAEEATKRVSGVRTVAQDLTVKLVGDHKHTDSEIAGATQNALKWDVFVPNAVTAKVHDGSVTLEGEVPWNYQREAAARSVGYLTGVVAVNNRITLKPKTSAAEVKERVQAALQRQATADIGAVHVETSGGRVTLTGHASSWHTIQDAADAAWAAPGVTDVANEMTVSSTV